MILKDSNDLSEIRRYIKSARNHAEKSSQKQDIAIECLNDMLLLEWSERKVDNLLEMICSYILHGEYGINEVMDEIKDVIEMQAK
jgi:hypothetical protein